jgi:hypothetical protein
MAVYDLADPLRARDFELRARRLAENAKAGKYPPGTCHPVELAERQNTRTLAQNRYLHVILAYFGAIHGYTAEEVKTRFFKVTCNPEIFVTTKRDKFTGQDFRSLRSSAEIDSAEMMTAIERFRNWAAMTAGTYIPTPAEHDLITRMELTIETTKNYI